MSWLNATQVLPEADAPEESPSSKKSAVVGYLVIFDTNHTLIRGENKIGRDPSQCSIVLENKTLSKVHAVIESEGPDDTFIFDEKSTNKTRLGKTVLKPYCRYKVNDGDTITFGNIEAKFKAYLEEDDLDLTPDSLLPPSKTPNKGKENQRNVILESPNDSIYEAETQCKLDRTSSPDVFKTPQSVKSKFSRISSSTSDDIFSAATQSPISNDDSNYFDDSDIYDQPTQCNFKTPERPSSSRKTSLKKHSDIFEMDTQIPTDNDSIFDQATQIPRGNKTIDDDIYEAETQCPVRTPKKIIDDKIFDAATQIPGQRGSNGDDDDEDGIYNAATQVPGKNIFDMETQMEDDNIYEAATQVPSRKSDIFEAETQLPKDDIFEAATQVRMNGSIFDEETQRPAFSACSPNGSDVYEAETQAGITYPDDSNEIIAAIPDSVYEEATQIPVKTPESAKKAKKRPLKHDNVSLFKGKRRSADEYLNDGQDDVLCDFMSKNSPAYIKQEKDEFDEEINLEAIPNHIFEAETQNHRDSGISDDKDETFSPNATVNDSGVRCNIDDRGKEDLIPTQNFNNKKTVVSSSSDEDCNVNRKSEDLIPTQLVSKRKEDEVPTQILKRNEDVIPTQVYKSQDAVATQIFRKQDSVGKNQDGVQTSQDGVATQIFNNIVDESSDDETDVEEKVDDSETDSDIEIKKPVKNSELSIIETSMSAESTDNYEIDDKSNDSFSLIKDADDTNLSPVEKKSSTDVNAKPCSTNVTGKNVAILKNKQPNLSPTQVISDDDLFDDKNDDSGKKTNVRPGCSPTQVIPDGSDSDTDVDEDLLIKSEPVDETQVLPLSPPANYQPRVLGKQDAWMLGKDVESGNVTPKREDDDDFEPLTLQVPSTQEFERKVKECSSISPEKPITSKRFREEDTETPRSKVIKTEPDTIFKTPNSVENSQISRPSRVRKPTWKIKEESEENTSLKLKITKKRVNVIDDESQDEDSPVIRIPNKKKPNLIEEDVEDQDSPLIQLPRKNKINLIDDDSQNEDSPVIKLPNRTKPKPCINEEEYMFSQVYEDESNISKRRSARIQKSGSNTSLFISELKPKKTRNSRKKSYFSGEVKVIFTGYENDKQIRIIRELNGVKTFDLKEANVVVTDKVRRTAKFLSALALGLPIVSPKWLERCSEEMEFIDPWPYLLSDKESEDRYEFNLEASITKAQRKKILDGYYVFATGNVKPPLQELYTIVECCGGKVLKKLPEVLPDKTIVVSCPEDEKHWPTGKNRNVKIVHYEFVMAGVLKQTLEFKTFNLLSS